MADSKNTNQGSLSMDAFRAKKAASASGSKTATGATSKTAKTKLANSTESVAGAPNSRPSSAKGSASKSKSSSVDNLNSKTNVPSVQQRQDKVKQMRDKQAEDRKRKNEERRLAFEERRRQKEDEEKQKWDSMKQQAARQRPGTGRKLPNLPEGLKRPASASNAQTRPAGLPKPLKATVPVSSVSGSPVRSPGQSSSGRSSDSSPRQSPSSTPSLSHGKGGSGKGLGKAKSTSQTNLDSAQRRSSAGNLLQRPTSASNSRPASLCGPQPRPSSAKSHDSLAAPSRTVKKAHSTSALHHIGMDRSPMHSPKKRAKEPPKPKAGMMDEAAAKQALAERRKKAREEAERLAKLDKERQEQERIKKEEEDRLLAEEMAKEEERVQQLAEMLKQQEEERLVKAMEDKERHDQEEAERLVEELRIKEEENKIREEQEKIAKVEEEKKAKEDEERRKQEEIERQERRKRVEEIMSRTRQTKTGSPCTDMTADSATSPTQELKEIDLETTKRKVSEILQKAKSSSPQNFTKLETGSSTSSLDNDSNPIAADEAADDEPAPSPGHMKPIDSADDILKSIAAEVNEEMEDSTSALRGGSENLQSHSEKSASENVLSDSEKRDSEKSASENVQSYAEDSVVKVRVRISDSSSKAISVNGRELTRTISHESDHSISVPSIHIEGDGDSPSLCSDGNAAINGLEQREMTDVRQDNSADERSAQQDEEENQLWIKTESIMIAKEAEASERLENAGIVAEGVDDTEEAHLWKVVEGNLRLSDVA